MSVHTELDRISTGCHIEVELVDREGKKERFSLEIVPDSAADYSRGFLGESTPLAKALIGEKAGTVIPYLKDDILSIEILVITTSMLVPPADASENREAKLKKTIREVEHTNAMVFASSFSGKWGDYDPDSLPKEDTTGDT